MSTIENNRRRLKRMDLWISHAEAASGDDDSHLRFLFYWIAYEAAYQTYETGKSEGRRKWLHKELARHDPGELQSILREQRDNVVRILDLRQAHPSFWRKDLKVNEGVTTPEAWGSAFRQQVESATKCLDKAVRSGAERDISATLNDLFSNLSVVRNQIAHGANAGAESQGLTQVILGAWLLKAFIPRFRDAIKANLDADWGEPPFPRVGSGPDDKCPPPWLSGRAKTPLGALGRRPGALKRFLDERNE